MRIFDSVQTIPSRLHMTGLWTLAILVASAILSWSSPPIPEDGTPKYTDHKRLMYYLDSQGKEHPVKNKANWEIRRYHLLTVLIWDNR